MKESTIVQFVFFDTTLDSDEFVLQWEHFNKLVTGHHEVTLLQKDDNKNVFRYVSLHKCSGSEFQFIFKKERRLARFPEVEIKVKQAGGYVPLQVEHMEEANANESKILAFINGTEADLDAYRQFPAYGKLNIYEAYYESCEYTYILEFFVENIHANELLLHLKQQTSTSETGIYKECLVHA